LDEYFQRVPLLYKSDLMTAQHQAPPFGSWPSTDPALAARYHQTSGTSGHPPIRTFDTARDWVFSVDTFCTALHAMGVRPGYRGMAAFGYGLFMGFWGIHYALERMGCMVFPSGNMDSKTRIQFLVEHQIEVLGCTPSYAMRLIETAREIGVDLATEANVKVILAGAEPRPDSTTQAIADAFGAGVYNAAGTTELGAVSMFECRTTRNCCHINESGVIEEVLHPETHLPVGYGEKGVRVTTGLGRESMQIFRHWTEDLVIRRPSHECGCGRTWDWYDGGILGRVDDMKKIRGVSLTPVMIEDVLRGFPEVGEHQTVLRTDRGLDTVLLRVEVIADLGADIVRLPERISDQVKHEIVLRPQVEIVDRGALPRFELKAARFYDERAR
ncbi:AMP-binding protein, partial [Saccharothrix sp. MB29]|nr:AMP-binding protein [Saccharothrix sp. MB29]